MTLAILAAVALAAAAPAAAESAAPAAAPAPAPASRVLSLDDAVKLALEHHPDLRGARADVSAASARVGQARASLLPQLGASASYDRQHAGSGADARESDVLAAGASVDQLVWDFGRSTGAVRSARASADASEAGARETERAVVRDVRQSFAEARARHALTDVADETAENARLQLARVEVLVEVGSRPRFDLAQARSDAALARVTAVQARSREVIARATLARAMGVDDTLAFELANEVVPAVAGEDEPAEALLARAAVDRPAVAQLADLVRAQEATVSATRGGYLPRLSVGASASAAGERPGALDPAWSAGATLSWTLFDGGATAARVREAEAGRVALLAQADGLRQRLRLELEQALAGVSSAKAAGAAAVEALEAAAEGVRLAEARYQTGSGTLLELSTARTARATAAGQVIQASWDLSAARADLAVALGEA
jgi:outer membrane protein